MNLQVIASPDGDVLWVSGALPGSVHDKKAEWVWSVLNELERQGLVTLADKGYQGSAWAKISCKGKPESQEANRAHPKLRGRGKNERPAQGSSRHGTSSTSSAAASSVPRNSAKAIHVLQLREA